MCAGLQPRSFSALALRSPANQECSYVTHVPPFRGRESTMLCPGQLMCISARAAWQALWGEASARTIKSGAASALCVLEQIVAQHRTRA
jgi:hypothetical protein